MIAAVAAFCVGIPIAGAGCGGSDEPDQAALEQARQEGAQAARQNARIRELERKVRQSKKDDQGDTTVPSASSAEPTTTTASSYVSTYVPYTSSTAGFTYSAEVPSGGGWSPPAETVESSGRLRTTMRGPDGTLLLIDYTPNDVPQLGGSYDAASASLQTNFGTATKYTFSSSESLPDCNGRPCVDYFINDGSGGGWAVLGGGPSLSVADSIASHVAQSISYSE